MSSLMVSTLPIPSIYYRIRASSAAPRVDFNILQSAIAKKDSNAVKEALDQLKEEGWAQKWSSQPYVSRCTRTWQFQVLGMIGGNNRVLAVLAGQLPGDWGFFVPYLIGSISLIVLAAGSISPGLAVVAMAGLAAEGLQYDKVVGQSADLFTRQRFINRIKPPLSKEQQLNLTRWAVLFSGSIIKNNKVLHEAIMKAMSNKVTVLECIEAIEKAA